jgi:glyoxylase-like metal-dependent hydrolase (beta-lactamase superfamily II)
MAGLAAPSLIARRTAPEPLFDRGFARVIRIAEGVYATLADPSRPECMSNGGVLAGRDATLIVEGHFQPAGAALEVEVARAVGKVPIRAAVDTHFHLDHSFGNRAYAEQRIPIIAHEQTAILMRERYGAIQGAAKTDLLAPYERKLASAADATDRERRRQDLEKYRWMYAAIDAATLAYPTELLRGSDLPKRIDLGGLTAVIEFHPGHSPTDVVIRAPERDVAFAGDLLFHRAYPVSIDADVIAWRRALNALDGYGRGTRFIPGHGPVCGLDTVRAQMALLDHLRSHAERMLALGATVDEAERRYTPAKAFQDYRIGAWGWTIGAAIENLYGQLGSRPHTKR